MKTRITFSSRVRGILTILACTFLTSSAQILLKTGANILYDIPLWANWKVFLGLFCYGIGAVLLVLGLRDGEVSSLYPILATSYIWVTIFSSFLFGELLHILKIFGVIFIVAGISIISFASKPKESIHYEEAL